MSINLRIFSFFFFGLLLISGANAEIVSERGVASVDMRRSQPNSNERNQARAEASLNALQRYVATLPASQQSAFGDLASDSQSLIEKYVLSTMVLSEEAQRDSRRLTVAVRVELNGTKLNDDLLNAAGLSATVSANATEIVSIMIARSRGSVQTFNDRVYRRTDTSVETDTSVDAYVDIAEEEATVSRSTRIHESVSANARTVDDRSERHESGGSVTRRADEIEWKVAESSNVDQQISGILTDIGLNIIPAEFVPGIDLSLIRTDFSTGNDIQPTTMRSMASGLQEYDIPYVLIGSLDIDLPSDDPMTGNQKVFVTVNAKLINLEGRFPRVEAAIGPTQFAGLGPSSFVAEVNAVKLAAENVGRDLLERFASKNIR